MNGLVSLSLARNLDEECSVCLEGMLKDEHVYLTRCCNHHFHQDCLKEVQTCPHCRTSFVPTKAPIQQQVEINLNEEQMELLRELKNGKNVFITGPAGVGKTTVVNEFREWCKRNFKRLGVTSTTGVSALLIKGTTLHRWAGIGLGTGTVEQLIAKIKFKPAEKNWTQTDILIIDEVSMLTFELLSKLEVIARRLRRSEKLFGGMQIIFSGDFCQLPAINSDYILFETPLFKNLVHKTFYLKTIHRQSNTNFQKILMEARMGNLSPESIDCLKQRITKNLPTINGVTPTVLHARKVCVEEENRKQINELKKAGNISTIFKASITVQSKHGKNISMAQDEFLRHSMLNSCVAYEILELCKGTQVMICANIDLELGLANGTRGVVKQINDDHIIITLVNGDIHTVNPWKWELEDESTITTMHQIPLIPAFSVSIHKIQGATLDLVAVNLGSSVFEYGQAYVALSRVRNLDGLFLTKFTPKVIKTHPAVLQFYTSE